jgi:hypothetical protein
MKMTKFAKWLSSRESSGSPKKNESTVGTEDVDSSQIERLYGRAKQSVQLVRMYDSATGQRLLTNISTIANLAAGSAFGVYMSGENRKSIGADVLNRVKLIYPNDPSLDQKLQKLPKKTIMQYLPKVDPNRIVPSDMIHVDVAKHLAKFGDTPAAVIELASTIVHEATHVLEYETTGQTKDGPGTAVEIAEAKFKNWVKTNWQTIARRFNLEGNYPFR